MESGEKVDVIKKAIAELMMELEEEDDELNANKSLHLNKLLSELELLEEDKEEREVGNEEIMKELKNVKRQNSITHYLLTAMILLTVGWQLSEVSLILKIKHGLTNPFKSAGGLLTGFLKSKGGQDAIKAASDVFNQPTDLKIPTLDFPAFDTTATDEDDDLSNN